MIDTEERVILVGPDGRTSGVYPKLEAHVEGLRHLAVSVLIRNPAGELLLQRRADAKYHSGGLWANACCSHPRPGEAPVDAAQRRLHEELGFVADLRPLFVVEYRERVGALIEDEYVHVFGGEYSGSLNPDPAEVSGWRWMNVADIHLDVIDHPDAYAVWFRKYLELRGSEIRAFAVGAK